MSGVQIFPRRRRPAQRRIAPAPTRARTGTDATREALDIARYVSDMAAQLEAMSAAVDLDLLAYFLGMARAEAEFYLHVTAEPEPAADPGAGEAGGREPKGADPVD
jgi:hypothetical protein